MAFSDNALVRRVVAEASSPDRPVVNDRGELNHDVATALVRMVLEQQEEGKKAAAAAKTADELASAAATTLDQRPPARESKFRSGVRSHAAIDHGVFTNGDLLASDDYRKAFMEMFKTNKHLSDVLPKTITNVASAGTFADGGWLMVPIEFAAGVQRCVDKMVAIRQLANVVTVSTAVRLGIRVETKQPNSFAWGCRCVEPASDSPQGDVKELEPHLYTAATSICGELLRKSAIDMEGYLQDALARDISYGLENAFMYGDGKAKPLGVLNPQAFATTRDVDVSGGTITGDLLIKAIMTLGSRFMQSPNLAWVMSYSLMEAIMKLKTTTGAYIWSLTTDKGLEGSPFKTSLLGIPVIPSEFITVGSAPYVYPAVLADWSQYMIAEVPMQGVERDRTAATDKVTWYSRNYLDAMPICEQAFVRLKNV